MGTTILGYDPKKYYQGPGPLEAASLGVAISEHDVVSSLYDGDVAGRRPVRE